MPRYQEPSEVLRRHRSANQMDAEGVGRVKCPTRDFECKVSFGNHCSHCIHFWSQKDIEEMDLAYLEDLRI